MPLAWLCVLYVFTLLCWVKLGHFPIPSLNDPKDLGFRPLYLLTIIGLFVTIYAVFLWLLLLPLSIYYRLLSKRNVMIMLIGIAALFAQLVTDAFDIINWLLD